MNTNTGSASNELLPVFALILSLLSVVRNDDQMLKTQDITLWYNYLSKPVILWEWDIWTGL
jgi:hypothetical protein